MVAEYTRVAHAFDKSVMVKHLAKGGNLHRWLARTDSIT
jgi:hypothetical protein